MAEALQRAFFAAASGGEGAPDLAEWCGWIFALNATAFESNRRFVTLFIAAVAALVDASTAPRACSLAQLFPRDYDPVAALQLFGISAKVRAAGPPKSRPSYDLYAKSLEEVHLSLENLVAAHLALWLRRQSRLEPAETRASFARLLGLLGGAVRVNPEAGFLGHRRVLPCRFCKAKSPAACKAAGDAELGEASDTENCGLPRSVSESPEEASGDELRPINWGKYLDADPKADGGGTAEVPATDSAESPETTDETLTLPVDEGGEWFAEAQDVEIPESVRWWKATRTFCSLGCQYMHILSSSGQMIRHRIEIRDKTVCANCGVSAQATFVLFKDECQKVVAVNQKSASEEQVELISCVWYAVNPWGAEGAEKTKDTEAGTRGSAVAESVCARIRRRLQKSWFMEVGRRRSYGLRLGDLWQADHILPVKLGGGVSTTLFNLRTLCSPCHRAATQHLAKHTTRQPRSKAALQGSAEESPKKKTRAKGMRKWYGRM